MECGRLRRLWLIPAGLVILPAVLWVLIVVAAPTSWARNRFALGIERATGRTARLDRLSVCFFGGLRLSNLEIGAPGTLDDPWLRAREVSLDLSPLSVLGGSSRLKNLEVYDATLRILRRKDGSFELSDLVRPTDSTQDFKKAGSDCCALGTCLSGAHRLRIGIHGTLIHVVDLVNATNYEVHGVEGEAILEGKSGGSFAVDGVLNGGAVQLSGQFDRTLKEPSFDIEVEATDVTLTNGMGGLRYLIPALAGEKVQVEGKLAGHASLQARGSEAATLRKSLRGRGSLCLAPVRLQGSSFLDAISKFAEVAPSKVSQSMSSQFRIADQRITTNSSTIQLGPIPVKLKGWTDFDGNLEYKFNLEAMTSRIPEKALRLLREIDIEVDKMGDLELSGTLDRLVVRLDGEPLKPLNPGESSRVGDDRDRLRELGRRVLERVVR